MTLGYDGKLYILAFDHRGSFQKKLFGIQGHRTPEDRDQAAKLKRLCDWLHDNGRKFLFELLVPAEDAQLEAVGGDTDRYDAELRPDLMRRAITELQDAGVEPDVWKIEGVDERSDAETLAETTRRGGRDGVVCVLLGRGASTEKV